MAYRLERAAIQQLINTHSRYLRIFLESTIGGLSTSILYHNVALVPMMMRNTSEKEQFTGSRLPLTVHEASTCALKMLRRNGESPSSGVGIGTTSNSWLSWGTLSTGNRLCTKCWLGAGLAPTNMDSIVCRNPTDSAKNLQDRIIMFVSPALMLLVCMLRCD